MRHGFCAVALSNDSCVHLCVHLCPLLLLLLLLLLPSLTGFFEDKKADAKARGEVPKNEKDMAKVGGGGVGLLGASEVWVFACCF